MGVVSDLGDDDLRVNTDLPFDEVVRRVLGVTPGDEDPDDDDEG